MCDNVGHNPFAGLFSNPNEAVSLTSRNVQEDVDVPKEDAAINDLVESVFGLTVREDGEKIESGRKLVFLEDLAASLAPQDWLNADSVEHAIFERLMLADPEAKIVSSKAGAKDSVDSHFVQNEIVPYLFESYCRLTRYRNSHPLNAEIKQFKQIVVRNLATALQEPDLFQGQEVLSFYQISSQGW